MSDSRFSRFSPRPGPPDNPIALVLKSSTARWYAAWKTRRKTNPTAEPVPTLFGVGDRKFVVTAGHVAERVDRISQTACAFIPREQEGDQTRLTIAPIVGTSYRVGDPADLAVVELTEESARGMAPCRFLPLSETAIRPEHLGCGWVVGYPNEYISDISADSRGMTPLTLGTVIRTDEPPGLANYDPFYHFLLDANRSGFGALDGTGPSVLPTRFHGISGSPVWQTWWPSCGPIDERRSRLVRVVGIQTSYYRTPSFLKATHFGCIVETIRAAFPDLRRILGMHFGPTFASDG